MRAAADSGTRWRHFSHRARTVAAVAALTAAMLPALAGALPRGAASPARADDVTASWDNLRTGWDPQEPQLSPGTVSGGTFGQLFSAPVDGQVYAQPIVVGSTLVVATENDWVYGLDKVTGAVIWSRQLGQPWPSTTIDCTDLAPNVGVTGTPVYDPATGSVYMVAETLPADGSPYHPVFDLFGLDAQTGAITLTSPIGGSPTNAPGRTFDPYTQLQRPGLLLLDGSVYAAFGSHCDLQPYAGYVAGVNLTTGKSTLWSDEAGITDSMGGIWQSGGGLMSDGSGRLFFASGNGVSPAKGPGDTPPSELAESVVRLGVGSGGSLAAEDFFSPANAPSLDLVDRDFGSGGPAALPVGSTAYPDLLVEAGKDGRLFVLNRDSLGGRKQGPDGGDAVLSQAGPFGGQFGHPAVFEADQQAISPNSTGLSDYVYYLGRKDNLRALQLSVNAAGTPILTDVANSAATFGFTSGSPVVTSNGRDPSSAVVWVVGSTGSAGTGGTLQAYDGVPQSGTLQQIWSAPLGPATAATASKFAIPATDDGRVYVGTRDGHVLGFGSPTTAPLTGGASASFPDTAVGAASPAQTLTVQATTSVTVTGITATGQTSTAGTITDTPAPFTAGSATLNPAGFTGPGTVVSSFPVTLNPGDELEVPVTFDPAAPGPSTGSLSFATNAVNFPTVNVSLSGNGTQDGLYASASTLDFGGDAPVPVGLSQASTVNIVNYGSDATVTGVAVTGPFTVSGLAAGADIASGQSVPVAVTYQPTAVTGPGSPDQGTLTVNGSTGNVSVALTGAAVAAVSAVTASPTAVNLGSVPLGQQATATIDLTNTGTLPVTLDSSAVPEAPFGTANPVSPGLPLNPGYDVQIPVTFTPTSVGAVTWGYQLIWTDSQGASHTLTVPVTGAGSAPSGQVAVPPPGGGWTANGSAQLSGTALVLTPAARRLAGSAVYPVPVTSKGLVAAFHVEVGHSAGAGAGGMTMSLLDPSRAGPTALGGAGHLLGFGGLAGVAVTLATVRPDGRHAVGMLGLATGVTGGHLRYAAVATLPDLRAGVHAVRVKVDRARVTVTVDGARRLSTAVTLPRQVLVSFTGSTGRIADKHTVSNIRIRPAGQTLPPPGGGWSFNAAAGMAGSAAQLTPARPQLAGSVVYPVPVRARGLQATFSARMNGGTGGDGLTFALLKPAATSPTSVGGAAALGFGGLRGIAVALDTNGHGSIHNTNFAGLVVRADAKTGYPVFRDRVSMLPPLRTGDHVVTVRITTNAAGTDVLIVSVDGEQIIQQAVPALNRWRTVRLAFTGSTTSLTDVHSIRSVAIAASP